MLKKLATIMALTCVMAPCAIADDDVPSWIMDTSGIGKSHDGTVRSDQLLELGTAPSNALQLEGENELRMGNLDQALVALQKSVEMAPLDMDKRMLYAQALEQKLTKQKKKDPVLYNFLVKQWVFIFKQAEFVDQTLTAKQHIAHLTGTVPKAFEKMPKFLNRVLIPEDGTAIGNSNGNDKVAASRKPAAE